MPAPQLREHVCDMPEYRENWKTNGYWTLAIPFVMVAAFVLGFFLVV